MQNVVSGWSKDHQQVSSERMDAQSAAQNTERQMEATSFPLSVTTDWLEDGNETTENQFQQPDWQVGEINKPETMRGSSGR